MAASITCAFELDDLEIELTSTPGIWVNKVWLTVEAYVSEDAGVEDGSIRYIHCHLTCTDSVGQPYMFYSETWGKVARKVSAHIQVFNYIREHLSLSVEKEILAEYQKRS